MGSYPGVEGSAQSYSGFLLHVSFQAELSQVICSMFLRATNVNNENHHEEGEKSVEERYLSERFQPICARHTT